MTLRNRVRLVVVVLGLSALSVLSLLAVGGGLRADSVDALSKELEADRLLVELESCMQDMQRQMAYFSSSLPQDGAAAALDDATGAPVGGVHAQLEASIGASIADCSQRGDLLERFAREFSSPTLLKVTDESALLLEDWSFVVDNIEVDYIVAVKRQAMSAQPRSEELFTNIFPSASSDLRQRVKLARDELATTSSWVDRVVLICLVASYVIVGITLFGLITRMSRGMQILTEGAIAFGKGELDYTLHLEGADEFERVGAEMNRMAGDLSRTTGLLEEHAQQLEDNLRALKETQADLVRKQRMASLGGLVAGVAHEVNTPLGVAFTAGTFCLDRFRELERQREQLGLTDDYAQEVVSDAAEALSLMIDNLSKAAHLLESFKQVAVDRGQAETRTVTLDEWLGGVLTSLSPLTRRHAIDVRWHAPSGIECVMASGELEQVISNLVVNAVVHAFPDGHAHSLGESPMIAVTMEVVGSTMWVRVSDNGRGMSPQELSQVFEPFFTTRRGAGGSGLGMHIVHQIIDTRFEGSISTETSAGHGTSWAIQIPHPTAAFSLVES